MAASANLHPGRTSMFEPVHGSAPKYAGSGSANPMAAVLTMGLLLEDLGHGEAASAIEAAVVQALGEGVTTQDLGGSARTAEVGDFLARALARGAPQRSPEPRRRLAHGDRPGRRAAVPV